MIYARILTTFNKKRGVQKGIIYFFGNTKELGDIENILNDQQRRKQKPNIIKCWSLLAENNFIPVYDKLEVFYKKIDA